MIIALTGKMGSGKTTVLKMLQSHFVDHRYIKFAAPLYAMQEAVYTIARLTPPKEKDRKLLQWLGTEWGRGIDENIWLNVFDSKVNETKAKVILCDDLRFLNEYDYLRHKNAFIIKMEGPQRGAHVTSTSHSSEADVDKMTPTFIIHNDSGIEKLEETVNSSLIPYIEAILGGRNEYNKS